MIVDSKGSGLNSLLVAGGFVESEDLAEGSSVSVELIGGLEGVDGFLAAAELLEGFSKGDKAGRHATL